jgi:CubicO group peptidase (beta-lactamase class C family)
MQQGLRAAGSGSSTSMLAQRHRQLAHCAIATMLLAGAMLSAGCGDQHDMAMAPPIPSVAILAQRGQPVADDVLLPWMQYYGIVGLSVAVASGDVIDWAQGYGVADASTGRPVTPDTTFQAASISKPIASVTALSLFDERGLDIDADVRTQLETWSVPASPLAQGAPVTLRLLLSHCAGFNVHGFDGYASSAPLPTLAQILDGIPPANNPPIRIASVPGAAYQYSGGGYEVMQQLLEDIAHGPKYAALAQARVFDRARMAQSSLLDPLDPVAAATPHDENGRPLAGRWHRYPELAAASVWTTPSDLVRFATALQRAYRGVSDELLPTVVARAMLTRQRATDVPNQFVVLGFFLEGPTDGAFFYHGGANAGYRAYLFGYADRPLSIAIMTNSEVGDRIVVALVNAIVAAYTP